MSDDLVTSGYDAVYRGLPSSPTFARIWREHSGGADIPDGFGNISFLTLDELGELSSALDLRPGDVLVDLACGEGGPGLWVAHDTGAQLIGIDPSTVGVGHAAARADALGLGKQARFRTGTFATTGLEAASGAGVMTVDALHYAPDKRAALAEIARVLNPSGRLAFTAFEVHPERVADLPVLGDDPVADFGPLVETAGLVVQRYDETAGWRERVGAAYAAVVDSSNALADEMGAPAVLALASEMTLTLERDLYKRRIFAVAVKR